MIPLNEEERKRILHAWAYAPTFKSSLYYKEVLDEVTKVCIEYNFRVNPDEFVHFTALCFPFLPRPEFYIVSAIDVFFWESDEVFDDPRHKMEIRLNQIDSLRSAVTSGKVEPYTHCADFLVHFMNQIKNEYLKKELSRKYLKYLDNAKSNLGKCKIVKCVEDIIEYRKHDSCCDFTFSLLFMDLEDPRQHEEFLQSGLGNKMALLATENSVFINDIVSLKNDKTTGSCMNTVLSWMKTHNVSEDEAIDVLALKAKKLYEELADTRKLTQDPVGLDVHKRLIYWTSGQLFWSIATPRYKK